MVLLEAARSQVQQENVFLNQKDLEVNLDKWEAKKGHNVLYVIGLSGSGKTTLAEKYERENKDAYMFELDGIAMNYDASQQGLLKKLYQTSPAYKELRDRMDAKEDIPSKEFDKLHKKSCQDVIKLMYDQHDKRWIVEGIQIYEFMTPEQIAGKPLVIKGTSMMGSIYQRFKRNANGGKIDWGAEIKNDIIGLLKWYAEENGLFDKFKRGLKEESDMMFYGLDGQQRPGLFVERSYGMFSELTVNGQQVAGGENDDDKPTDYTAGDDDNGAQETPVPTDQQDAGPEPSEGDDNNTTEDYTAEGNDPDPQAGGDNPTDAPEDYTVPDESNGADPQAADGPAEGEGEGAPEDYTGGETENPAEGEGAMDQPEGGGAPPEGEGSPEGGGAPEGEGGGEGMEGGDPGAEGGEDGGEGEETYGDDEGGGADQDSWDAQIANLQKDIYGDLTEPQAEIRDRELKQNFSDLYDAIDEVIERINDIPKDSDMLKPMEYVSNKLNELSKQVSDYLIYTFNTKTYAENSVNYQRFMYTLSQINDVLSQIKPAGKP